MPGKSLEDPTKSQQQEIADKKAECVRFFEKNGVKQAAADWIGRDAETIRRWEEEDADFKEAMLRAKATFIQDNRRKLKIDHLVANLYPEDFKPPKQEVESRVTVIEDKSAEDLLAEAKTLGLDTSKYESLLTSGSPSGTTS